MSTKKSYTSEFKRIFQTQNRWNALNIGEEAVFAIKSWTLKLIKYSIFKLIFYKFYGILKK